MSYATRADLEARFGATEIENLLGDGPDATTEEIAAAAAKLNAALADAAADINSAIADRYALPLDSDEAHPQLASIQCDLARLRLFDDEGIEEVDKRAQRARGRLMRLGDGTTRLVTAAGELVAQRARARVQEADARLARDDLEDA